jgi:hypothetical protein
VILAEARLAQAVIFAPVAWTPMRLLYLAGPR